MSRNTTGTTVDGAMKVCSCKDCASGGTPQPSSSFFNDKKTADGKMAQCSACSVRIATTWQKNNPKRHAASMRLYRYGITSVEYDRMLYEQHESCAICAKPFGDKTPHIDHCHQTDRVRGLLCGPCNAALGLLGESRATALSLVDYIDFECLRLPIDIRDQDD